MIRTLSRRPPLLLALLLGLGVPRPSTADESPDRNACTGFATNRYWSKGGMALLADDLFAVVKGERNELRLRTTPGRSGAAGTVTTWLGRPRSEREVVVIVEGRVHPWAKLPPDFDLAKAILVSFEADKVRFFDFVQARGGYYSRIPTK